MTHTIAIEVVWNQILAMRCGDDSEQVWKHNEGSTDKPNMAQEVL